MIQNILSILLTIKKNNNFNFPKISINEVIQSFIRVFTLENLESKDDEINYTIYLYLKLISKLKLEKYFPSNIG